MTDLYQNILEKFEKFEKFEKLEQRRVASKRKIGDLQEKFQKSLCCTKYSDMNIYCVGSLARGDVGKNSDLDIFIFTNETDPKKGRIKRIKLFNDIININKECGFPELSNDAKYLQVLSFPRMLNSLGSPRDDAENLFTARMLLLLESKCLFNENIYHKQLSSILENYFKDDIGGKTFKPIFLLNDILRFWRTLCLNYEQIRQNAAKPWRKKNINLKFSRMLSVFGTVLPLIAMPARSVKDVEQLITLSPLERLAAGVDMLNDDKLANEFTKYLENYEGFLSMKEELKDRPNLEGDLELSQKSRKMGDESSIFLHKCLTHANISEDLRKYLVL